MGKKIHLEKIENLFEKSPVVNFSSIKKIIRSNKKKSNYAGVLISNLLKKGKIKKIGKGIYTKNNEISLGVFAFAPSYLGLQSAVSYWGLWEQETIPIILTTKNVRRGIRKIMGANVLVRKINKKYFFGFNLEKEENFYLPYSDIEKTFIDLVVFKEKLSSQIIEKFKENINHKKLLNYLKKYPLHTRNFILKKLK